jgi:cell division initiation protein
MDLSSSLAGSKDFRIVKRGYDPDEVDAFLDQIALGVAELKRKLADANDRVGQAPEGAAGGPDAEEIHRALILAQRAADEEVRAAREEAERILADARTQAADAARRADVEVAQTREAGRAALEGEIAELEGVRSALQNDVVVLERHVEEQREVVQAAIGELQSLLDHPDAFRVSEPTGVSDVTAPPAAPPAPTIDLAEPAAEPAPEPEPTQAVPMAEVLDEEPDAGPEQPPVAAEGGHDAASTPPGAEASVEAPVEPPPAEAAAPSVEPSPPAATAADDDDDDFLAELRKAMHDEEPLGPRDSATGSPFPDQGDRRSLFGRRR